MKQFIFLCMLAACGKEPDYVTHQGISVFTLNGFPAMETVETSCAAVILSIEGRGWKAFDGLRLDVVAEVIVLADGRKVNGVYYGDNDLIQVHKTNDCWARNAFVHELIHLFQWERDQVDDLLHEDPKWWAKDGIEDRAYKFAIETECPGE